MEEDEYRQTYHQVNDTQCAFEKAILNRRCACSQSHKFCLAEREGVSCKSRDKQLRCTRFLVSVREKAQFVLKLPKVGEPLPYGKEIRVEVGSITGLISHFSFPDPDRYLQDIDMLMKESEQNLTSFEELPLEPIIRAINEARGRSRKSRKKP